MSNIRLRLPDSLHEAVRQIAEEDGVSINQFITTAVAEKVAVMKAEQLFQARAAQGSRARYEAALAAVPDVPPDEHDRIDPAGKPAASSARDESAESGQ